MLTEDLADVTAKQPGVASEWLLIMPIFDTDYFTITTGTITPVAATTTVRGAASFNASYFTVTAGAVTPKTASITETKAGTDAVKIVTSAGLMGSFHYTTAKTADYTVATADLYGNQTFINTGAGAEVNFTMPAAVVGMRCRFVVTVAQYLKVTADGTETFRYAASTGAAGGYVRSNTIGTTWECICAATGLWTIVNLINLLNYDE